MEKIRPIKIEKNISVSKLIDSWKWAGFQARRIYKAVSVYKTMLSDKSCCKFLCLAGALIPGGLRGIIKAMIENKLVDQIITTGSNITHDLIEAFGEHHFTGSALENDLVLEKRQINRIYNVYLPNKAYTTFEDRIQAILPKIEQKRMGCSEFFGYLGKFIEDQNSFIKVACAHKIPIYCPSLPDSILGFQLWMFQQDHKLIVDPGLDMSKLLDIAFEKERKIGALIIGGGVPKHYIAMAMQVSGRGLNYAIQITLDRPEHGGVSGAPLSEAKSWHKVEPDAKIVDVICDATIALPLIVSALC